MNKRTCGSVNVWEGLRQPRGSSIVLEEGMGGNAKGRMTLLTEMGNDGCSAWNVWQVLVPSMTNCLGQDSGRVSWPMELKAKLRSGWDWWWYKGVRCSDITYLQTWGKRKHWQGLYHESCCHNKENISQGKKIVYELCHMCFVSLLRVIMCGERQDDTWFNT